MPYFSFDNINIYYEQEGCGEAVLLIHGFLENCRMWDDISEALSKNRCVIRLDLPGFGKSDIMNKPYSMSFLTHCIGGLLTNLKIDECTLVGHSMGGYIALAALETYSEKINHICLYHSTAKPDSVERKKNRQRAMHMVERKKSAYLNSAIPFLFQEKLDKACAINIEKMMAEAHEITENTIIAALKGMGQRQDTSDLLKAFSGKKTYISGAADPVLNRSDLRQEASDNQADYLEIDTAGHMSHIEAPEKAIQFISKALL